MRAVVVFCEGHADVIFVGRSLGVHGDCEWVEKAVVELPSPIGGGGVAGTGLMAMRLQKRALDQLAPRATAYPLSPYFDSVVENPETGTMYFLVFAGGKSQSESNLVLLGELHDAFSAMPATDRFDISEYAAAFLFDANTEGVAATLGGFRSRYQAHFGDLPNLKHGQWATTRNTAVGCFVFHESDQTQTGTLEDHLAPMIAQAWPRRFAGAESFVERHRRDTDKVSKSRADRLKATITITGQFDHPGRPMSTIVSRDGIPAVQFQQSGMSADLANFLSTVPWRNA